MKVLDVSSVVALLFTIFVPNAVSQDNVPAEHKPMRFERITPQGTFVQFVSATVRLGRQERFASLAAPTRVRIFRPLGTGRTTPAFVSGDIIHFEGNVEITIFNKALMFPVSTLDELTKEVVLTADEADYNVDTGEIQPQGHVSIKFEDVESRLK
jgi:hypothetical protein